MRSADFLTPFQRLFVALLLLLCFTTASSVAEHSLDINPKPSPKASTDLICPNDNPSDCYPVLFQPTIRFQKIRPDQSLPPGLHVRLNIQTGEKEARLNVPEEKDIGEEAVVVIDAVPHKPETVALGVVEEEAPLQLRLQDALKQEKHARPYTPPRPSSPVDPDEVVLYDAAISIIKQKSSVDTYTDAVHDGDILSALETLTELAHSLDWGLTLCRDAEFSRTLLAFIGTTSVNGLRHTKPTYRSATLLLMATAVQNNQDALLALLGHAHGGHGDQGPLEATLQSLALDDGREGGDPIVVARSIFFLSQLCANDEVLAAYLSTDTGGFPHLLRVFADSVSKKDANQAKLRHRIANFVEDHAERTAALLESQADTVVDQEVETFLRPWCDAFSSAMSVHGDGLMEVLEAKAEVSKVLETHTGRACGSGVEHSAEQGL